MLLALFESLLTGSSVAANLAPALLICAVLIDIALAISIVLGEKSRRPSYALWLLFTLFTLAFSVWLFQANNSEAQRAADTVLVLTMLVLTFPTGWVAILILGYVVPFVTIETSYGYLLFSWMLFLVCGYVQWFTLLPLLRSKIEHYCKIKKQSA